MILNVPSPVFISAFLIPFTITYLVHYPRTRPIRIALWQLGIFAMVWTISNLRSDDPILLIRLTQHVMLWNVSLSTRWAFASGPPLYLPAPQPLYGHNLRRTPIFKTIGLMINDWRHVGLVGYTWRDRTNRQSYFQALRHHLFYTVVHLVGVDVLTYPLFRLAPLTLGSPYVVGGDFDALCSGISTAYRLPVGAVKLFWTIVLGSINYHGLTVIWHILALAGIGAGIWSPSEYPRYMHKPWLSTSLNEFWGRRYHQIMRDQYLLCAKPVSHFPRPVHIMSVFLISALYHHALYYPIQQHLNFYPYLLCFGMSGLGAVLERQYLKTTGKPVRGVWGAAWLWIWLIVWSQPLVAYEYSTGLTGAMRADLATTGKQGSIVLWVVYWLGYGPSPLDEVGWTEIMGR